MKSLIFVALALFSFSASAEYGLVKYFRPELGFGFIKRLDKCNTNDVFVGLASVEESSLASIEQLDCVSFSIAKDRGEKTHAINIQLIDSENCEPARSYYAADLEGLARRPSPDYPGCKSRR